VEVFSISLLVLVGVALACLAGYGVFRLARDRA
jgi:hypothetical protein